MDAGELIGLTREQIIDRATPIETKDIDKMLVKHDRLTLRLMVHQEHLGDDPFSGEANFSAFLDNNNQPFSRRQDVTDEWTNFQTGWLRPDDVGYIIIQNRAGAQQLNTPTEEEQSLIDQSNLYVQFAGNEAPFAVIRPKRCLCVEVYNFSSWQICCTKDLIVPAKFFYFSR